VKALVAADGAEGLLEFVEVEEPRATVGEVVVAMEASSVNHGEVEWLRYAPPGWRAGWDVCGRIAEGPGGDGLAAGTPVIGFLGETAWAERVAVPVNRIGTIAEGCARSQAAAIPVVGLTALRALRVGGLLAGKRVAILGANGAIGRVAIQLAARADATVTALVRDPDAAAGLTALGASKVVAEPGEDRYELVLDGVGGAPASAALKRLAPEGTHVIYGNAAGAPVELDPGAFFGEAPEARIHSLRMDASRGQGSFGADLEHLSRLVAAGELDFQPADPVDWGEAPALPELNRSSQRCVGGLNLRGRGDGGLSWPGGGADHPALAVEARP
jgi:NADPH:quinone reductase-like Zn-dependent oxidoreductase